ncbi:MAG TPA: hypothetical protein VK459_11050 [Polyangiaceae bacterium]|nr:hypothetical protein [Polyangiaceae bacterium]
MSHSMRRALHGRAWTTAAAPILACAGLFAGGCAHLPPTGAKATGEPLVVNTRTDHETVVIQQKVGEVTHRTSSGRYVGTSAIYENQTVALPDLVYWQVFQGKEKLDDQDFFRIGGDADAAAEIAAMRDNGVTLNRVGIVIFALGSAAAVSGLVLMRTERTGSYTNATSPLWTAAIAYGGLFTAVTGGSMALYGRSKTKREHPIDDPERAKRVAEKYNASIGAGPGPAEPK